MHLLRSILLHLLIIGIVVVALSIGSKNPENSNSIVDLENAPASSGDAPQQKVTVKNETPLTPVQQLELGSTPNQTGHESISDSEMKNYILEISKRINQLKKYPETARMHAQEGVVEVLLEVAPNGKILHTEITRPTAFESLNQAALTAVQRIGGLPPLPVSDPIRFRITIQFKLE